MFRFKNTLSKTQMIILAQVQNAIIEAESLNSRGIYMVLSPEIKSELEDIVSYLEQRNFKTEKTNDNRLKITWDCLFVGNR